MKKIYKNEIIMYLISGSITTFTNWFCYAAMVSSGIDLTLSNSIAWLSGVVVAFLLNKNLVFKSSNESWLKEFGLFIATRLFTGIIEIFGFPILLLIPVLKSSVFSIEAAYAKVVMTVIITVLNYICGKIVFKKNE